MWTSDVKTSTQTNVRRKNIDTENKDVRTSTHTVRRKNIDTDNKDVRTSTQTNVRRKNIDTDNKDVRTSTHYLILPPFCLRTHIRTHIFYICTHRPCYKPPEHCNCPSATSRDQIPASPPVPIQCLSRSGKNLVHCSFKSVASELSQFLFNPDTDIWVWRILPINIKSEYFQFTKINACAGKHSGVSLVIERYQSPRR